MNQQDRAGRHDAPEILVEVQPPGFAEVTLNRPARLNALNHSLLIELRQALHDLDERADVRCIVLTGAGRAFSSGADLGGGPSDAEQVVRQYYIPLVVEMTTMRTPLVAAVNGPAAGAGFSLALACDLRIGAQSAYFQLSFVHVGLVPDAGATWLLPRAVGLTRAMQIGLLGERVSATAAAAWNLVNEVVGDDLLLSRAREIAAALADSSATVGDIKLLLGAGLSRDLPDQLEAEASVQGIVQRHPHYAEARQAFRERRSPRFW